MATPESSASDWPELSPPEVAHLVHIFFRYARIHDNRASLYERPESVKNSLKYYRYLRDNFHSLDTFNTPREQITALLVEALAMNLLLGSGDSMEQEMEEMATLIPEVLTLDVSTDEPRNAIIAFTDAVTKTEMVRQKHTRHIADRVIRMLREATVLKPDSLVCFALASCLAARFQTTHVISDYEEAITITDRIVAAIPPEETIAPTQYNIIRLILELVSSRLNSYANPEYLEDSIHRLRALLRLSSLSLAVENRTHIVDGLNIFVQQRSNYFGVTANSLGKPLKDPIPSYGFVLPISEALPDNSRYRTLEKSKMLNEIHIAFDNHDITDVEEAIERARTLLPPSHSSLRFSWFPAVIFAGILRQACDYKRTKRPDYLLEAITAYRDIRKMSAPKSIHFDAGQGLFLALLLGTHWFGRRDDFEEAMQLASMVANDGSAEVFRRYYISYTWAHGARAHAHSSTSTAYETAMSLMQGILVFSPTLQTQHFRLVDALGESEGLPSDYASYQIETNQHQQAIETLERARGLLWSEMRGLRTSTDQLRAVDPASADKFADINRQLESVTMSVAQSETEEMGDTGTGTGSREEIDSIGRLVAAQQKLLEQRNTHISDIQSIPGLESFLKPPSFDYLNSAAAHGPVIITNQSRWRSYIIILHKDLPPSVISTPSSFHDRAKRLKDELLRVRNEKGLDSNDYDLTLASVLADLYELVGKPVIERLRQLEVPEKSRVWWCPTSAFCSLPLHAMGPIPSDNDDGLYFMDLYISSYTPTLSALIESRKVGSQPERTGTSDKPSLLLVAQPETLPGAWGEIDVIQAIGSPVTTLVSEKATPTTVAAGLRNHRFVHFVCHGLLETGKPFDASFKLHGDNLTLLEIVRSQLPAAEFAFLSACHTAELTEDSIADEGLHLAAAMQYCGFPSVVGTMWAMADTDGRDLSKHFYKYIFSDRTGQRGVTYYERSARALQFAVKRLRRKRGVTGE